MIDDIEDDYDEYLSDELGYAWDAWDALPAETILRHDAIVDATADELGAMDPAGLDDLNRWAYARAARRHGDLEGALEAMRLVLRSTDEHPGMNYPDAWVATIEALAAHEACDEAALHLGTYRERWPEDTQAVRLGVRIAARSADVDAALQTAREALQTEPDRLFEIAEDLVALGDVARAGELLEYLTALPAAAGRRALATDVALLRATIATAG